MPRHAKAESDYTSKLPKIRKELSEVIGTLTDAGQKQNAIATSAGWTGPYLSQFLTKPPGHPSERRPKPDKMRALLQTLNLLVEGQPYDTAETIRQRIRPIAELCDLTLTAFVEPGLPIPPSAPNYVEHGGIRAFIENNIRYPGVYALEGDPGSGASSALAHAAELLRGTGSHVVEVSFRELLRTGDLGRSNAGVAGALVARLDDRKAEQALSASPWDVAKLLTETLDTQPEGTAFVLDDLDALDQDAGDDLVSWTRNIKQERGRANNPSYARVTFWLAFTGNVRQANARDRSWLLADIRKLMPWFEREDVTALAHLLAPRALGAGARSTWAADVALEAWRHFEGQPRLTHQYLWERSAHGDVTVVPPNSGPYRQHLDALSNNAIGLLGLPGARQLSQCMRDGAPMEEWMVSAAVGRLRIARSSSSAPSCEFYANSFVGNLEYRINASERKARSREDA